MILAGTSAKVVMSTSSTADIAVCASWTDITPTTLTGGNDNTLSNTAAVTDIVGSPAASTQRQIKNIKIYNYDTTDSNTITVSHTDGVLSAVIYRRTLAPYESIEYDGGKWVYYNAQGIPVNAESTDVVGFTGFPFEFHKIGTAAEAIGNWYAFFKDSGFPGAYSLGAPGLNGWWVDASQTTNAANPAGAAQVGVNRLVAPASGSYYVNDIGVGSSVAHLLNLIDIIWYNTGAVVTTTTAQGITVPAGSKPARDTYGTTNGDGWQIGILVTTATTNAGAITNMTCSYTDSDGNAGNTATIASFPATAVIGTFVPFQLAAGDRGVRSVESLTLGTSLVTGAVSLVIYRNISAVVNPVANVGGIMNRVSTDPTGVRIYNGSALNWIYRAAATTATTMNGTINIVER